LNSEKYETAKRIFDNEYFQKIENTKYKKSQIKAKSNKVILNNSQIIKFGNLDFKGLSIVENGLLNPKEIDGNNKISICCIEELVLLNPNVKTRRFRVWVFPYEEKMLYTLENESYRNKKPIEYYFELQNENYTKNMTWNDFILNAKLTFIAFGKNIK